MKGAVPSLYNGLKGRDSFGWNLINGLRTQHLGVTHLRK
jgi:hypothetical protein